MLVLSRGRNKSVVINGDIIVTVLEVRGNQVKLGIDAPGEVPVHRQEVADAIASERSHKASDKRTISKPVSDLGRSSNAIYPSLRARLDFARLRSARIIP